jgi:hypothetical protein
LYNPQELALYNFHGQWYTDSDKLEAIARFRFLEPNEYFERTNKKIRLVKRIPFLKRVLPTQDALIEEMNENSKKERGTAWMLAHHKMDWIKAFWGSLENKEAIKSWEDGYELLHVSKEPTLLNHGYDEDKPTLELNIEDMKKTAVYRGGVCLSEKMAQGDLYSALRWQCYKGHTFQATPYLILKAGHWCPQCEEAAWDHAGWAKFNPFFAQVWTPVHGEENGVYVKKVVNTQLVDN